jgi:hypothetical protein
LLVRVEHAAQQQLAAGIDQFNFHALKLSRARDARQQMFYCVCLGFLILALNSPTT